MWGSGPCYCPEDMWCTRGEMAQMESGSSLQNVSNLQNLTDGLSPLEFINLFNKYILNPYFMPGTVPGYSNE